MINPEIIVRCYKSHSEDWCSYWNIIADVNGKYILVRKVKRDFLETKEHFEYIVSQLVSDYIQSSSCYSLSDIDFSKLDTDYMIRTNMGEIPIMDYLNIVAIQSGFDDFEDMQCQGVHINWEMI